MAHRRAFGRSSRISCTWSDSAGVSSPLSAPALGVAGMEARAAALVATLEESVLTSGPDAAAPPETSEALVALQRQVQALRASIEGAARQLVQCAVCPV